MTTTETKNVGEALCLQYRHDFERALGYELITGHLAFEPFLMAVKEDVLNSSKLADAFRANPSSAISCLLLSAQCKLLPGGKYGEFYLIPRLIKGFPTVTPLIGYKGLSRMAQRHPRVHSVEAFCVYEGEHFVFSPGEGKLEHHMDLKADHSDENLIGAYAKVVITEPTTSHVVSTPVVWAMGLKELHRSRSRSEAWKYAERGKKDSPWHTDYAAMCRKTALRAILSNGSVPRDMGVGGVLHQEEQSDLKLEQSVAPGITQGSRVRQSLGIDKPADVEPFGLAEEAVAHIQQAKDQNALEALAARWQHFTDMDAEAVALAYENRCKELGS